MKICDKCHQDLPLEDFHANRVKKDGKQQSCRKCLSKYTNERRVKTKLRAIEYLGNKCFRCHETFHYAVYDFHHLDPSVKEFEWTRLKRQSWKTITSELDKCMLLCANCHRMIHVEMIVNKGLGPLDVR